MNNYRTPADGTAREKMTEFSVKRPLRLQSIHPGEILREDVLPALGLSVTEMARRLGVSRQPVHRILAFTHPVTVKLKPVRMSSPDLSLY